MAIESIPDSLVDPSLKETWCLGKIYLPAFLLKLVGLAHFAHNTKVPCAKCHAVYFETQKKHHSYFLCHWLINSGIFFHI